MNTIFAATCGPEITWGLNPVYSGCGLCKSASGLGINPILKITREFWRGANILRNKFVEWLIFVVNKCVLFNLRWKFSSSTFGFEHLIRVKAFYF